MKIKKLFALLMVGLIFGRPVEAKKLYEYTLPEYTQKTIVATYNYVNIVVDGKPVNVANFVSNGTTYLGLRNLGNTFGHSVEWIQEKRLAKLTKSTALIHSVEPMKESYTSQINVLENYANINVNNVDMYPRNLNYNGSLYISLRDAGAMFGYAVDYDANTRTAYLNSIQIDYESLYFKADGYEAPKSLIRGYLDIAIANGQTVETAIEKIKEACITNIALQKLTKEYKYSAPDKSLGSELFNKTFRDANTYNQFAKQYYNDMPLETMKDFCKEIDYNNSQYVMLADSEIVSKKDFIETYGKIAYENYIKNRTGTDECIECVVYDKGEAELYAALINTIPVARESKYSQFIYKNAITAYTKKLYISNVLESGIYVPEVIKSQMIAMNEDEISEYIDIPVNIDYESAVDYLQIIEIQRNIPELSKLGLDKKINYSSYYTWKKGKYLLAAKKIHNEVPQEAFLNFYDAFEALKSSLNVETNIDSINLY